MRAGLCGIIFSLSTLILGCGPSAPLTAVSAGDIPHTTHLTMKEGDAQRFQLPDGKEIAVWCERPGFPIGGEQQTKSGLKTAWGERPFVQPELVLKMQPDGSEVVSGWKSYIEQGAVITRGSDTSEYILYENLWQFSITEDLRAASDLPVTIKIVSRPKKGEEQ